MLHFPSPNKKLNIKDLDFISAFLKALHTFIKNHIVNARTKFTIITRFVRSKCIELCYFSFLYILLLGVINYYKCCVFLLDFTRKKTYTKWLYKQKQLVILNNTY